MPIYLGIDGGGTQTTCAVGDEEKVLASAVAGGSNMVRLGEHESRINLHLAIRQACQAASVTPEQVDAVVVGIAGASVPPVKETIAAIVRDLVPGDIEVVGDMVIALEAAFAGLPGIVAISGTGSVAFGRGPRGEFARAGGWGPAISDEGSGQWIGRRAVGAIMRALDSVETTPLLGEVLRTWNLESLEALVQKANSSPPPDFAQLFPAVQAAAVAGDHVSRRLLAAAGNELAGVAGLVIRRLWSPDDVFRVALGGGIFTYSAIMRLAFWSQLRADWPRVAVCFKMIQPVTGALWMARRLTGRNGQIR